MNTKDFLRMGVPLGQATRLATDFVSRFILGGGDKSRLHEEVAAIVANPAAFVDDPLRGEFAKALLNAPPPPRAEPVKYHQWGERLEHEAVMQMEKACLLPVSVAGALMPDAHVGYLFYPAGSKVVNGRFKVKPGLWLPKTTGCRLMRDAHKVAPGILKQLRAEHGVKEPEEPEKPAHSQRESIVEQAKEQLARRIKEGHWKSPHLYWNALKYMERGFGTAGKLDPKLVPRAGFIKLRDFLISCEDIENSASSYARTMCQILRLVPGVNPDFIKLLSKLPGNKGDGEKGNTIRDSELHTILVKQRGEEDETTRILIGLGLSGGPQIIDACFLRIDEIDWETGLITGHRVKSGEEFRFYAIPWLLELLRQRCDRLGPNSLLKKSHFRAIWVFGDFEKICRPLAGGPGQPT